MTNEQSAIDRLPPLTEFQKTILWAIERMPNEMANRWEIAWNGFPDKWQKPSGRGALMGHIERACAKMSDIVGRLDPKSEHDSPTYYKKRNHP